LRRGPKGRHGGKGGIALRGSKERMAAVIWGLQAQAPAPRPGVYGRKSLGVCVNDLPGERDGVLVGKEEDVGGFRICHIYELRVSTRCRRRGWGWGGMEWKASYICILLLVLGRCCEAEPVIYIPLPGSRSLLRRTVERGKKDSTQVLEQRRFLKAGLETRNRVRRKWNTVLEERREIVSLRYRKRDRRGNTAVCITVVSTSVQRLLKAE